MDRNHSVITVEVIVHAPVEKIWDYWTVPDHITKWNNASDIGIHHTLKMI